MIFNITKEEEIISGIPVLTKTSGNSTLSVSGYTLGNLVQLSFELTSTGEVAVGGNAWVGSIETAYAPKDEVSFIGFSGSTVLSCLIAPDGYVAVRVLAAKLPSAYSSKFGGMFIKA